MIVELNKNLSPAETNEFCRKLSEYKCNLLWKSDKRLLLEGDFDLLTRNLKNFPELGRTEVISEKYKLVNRKFNPGGTEIKFGDFGFSEDSFNIIAGPCAVESREQIFKIAEFVKSRGIKFLRGGVFKPRTSPYAFQGLKEEGLKLLAEVKEKFDLKIITEVMDASRLEAVSEVADIIQIGSRNMQNFSLLEAVGKKGIPVLLKRGMAATVEDYLMSAEHIAYHGNQNIILCERGIKTFETSSRNTLDLNSVTIMKEKSHLPVLVDPSHGTGIRDKVIPMALAGSACGADGLIIEIHNEPEKALSDGQQSLTFEMFDELLSKVKQVICVNNKSLS